MGNEFKRSVGRGTALLMALCLSLFGAVAMAADSPPATPASVHVVSISGNHWVDDVKIDAGAGDVEMRNSDCNVGQSIEKLSKDETELLRDFSVRLCTPTAAIAGLHLGVVSLPVTSGNPHVWTIATYDDGHGNFNNVRIDALPDALAVGAGKYVFYGIESGSDATHPRTTQLALMAENGGDLAAHIELFDEHGKPIGKPIPGVPVGGWTLYTVATDVRVGRAEVTTLPPTAGPATPASLFAIALTFDSRGGAPEVTLPKFVAAAAAP